MFSLFLFRCCVGSAISFSVGWYFPLRILSRFSLLLRSSELLDDELALRHSSVRVDFVVDLVGTSWSLSLLSLMTFTFLFGVLLAECTSITFFPTPSLGWSVCPLLSRLDAQPPPDA